MALLKPSQTRRRYPVDPLSYSSSHTVSVTQVSMTCLAYWAMCVRGTVTCNPPEPDGVEGNSKALVNEVTDKGKDKGGVNMQRPKRCSGGYPRNDDDHQTGTPVVRVVKKQCVKLNRVNSSKCSSSSSSVSSNWLDLNFGV